MYCIVFLASDYSFTGVSIQTNLCNLHSSFWKNIGLILLDTV